LNQDSSYSSYANVDADMNSLKDALRSGAVSVAFGVADAFYYYSSGLYTYADGCSESINHGMTAVGFGWDDENSSEYVIIRNSWADSWGDAGYVKIAMSANDSAGGVCDIYGYPNYPIIA